MFDETIAAVSTPPGEGGIGIVRISGPEAFAIGHRLFRFARLQGEPQSHKLYYGHIVNPDEGKKIDEALAVFMRGPQTFTREDVVELNCHGGILPLKKTLEAVLAAGARHAEPGEFTKRAFLNGRIDLAQAEAVIQVIRARTDAAMELGLSQLEGRLSAEIRSIRSDLLSVLAHLEASIDFPEHQDVEDMARGQLQHSAENALLALQELINTADKGRILREGIRTAIIGRPNVGKSSLLNALLRDERAIVTDIPGTTRDTLEESVNIGGVSLTIIDTAGIRRARDEVEKIGVERSRSVLKTADLILYVLDVSQGVSDEDRELLTSLSDKPCILIINKTDLTENPSKAARTLTSGLPPLPTVYVSALEQTGLGDLEQEIITLVFDGDVKPPQSAMVTSARHKDALRRAAASLEDMLRALETGYAVDLLAIDLHSSLEALGEITGESVGPDLAEEIFRTFCIGK